MTAKELPDKYLQLLYHAMENVKSSYKQIQCAGSPGTKYRERVYCYELYHQMRILQDKDEQEYPLAINGEIDKSGHNYITNGFNPDFIIHKQNEMTNNLCVIEVKVTNKKAGVQKDLRTVTCMLHCYKYRYGVLIFEGVTHNKVESTIKPLINDIEHLREHIGQIYIFIDNGSNQPVIIPLPELLYQKGKHHVNPTFR